MRIIGGTYRSRPLRAPRGSATRPTSDRVREALFGILESGGVVERARVLDLYAGSGALALEALSRGASRAALVESGRDAIAAIRHNVAALGLGASADVITADVGRAWSRVAPLAPFDLVFADPPWSLVDTGDASRDLAWLSTCPALAESAWVILEHSRRTPAPSVTGLIFRETRDYGDTALTFYKPAILGPPRTAVPAGPPSD
jgi:16S rRNA (guanine(966)-N(2))-methyltransferase RsmD